MNWYKRAYRKEETWLRDYLKEGFDPQAYEFYIKDYLNERGIPYEDNEYYEIFNEWHDNAGKAEQADFREWVEENQPNRDDFEGDRPSYEALSYPEQNKPGWLVHFTDDPWSIAMNGFTYGYPEFEGLHLTTGRPDSVRKSEPGYNFAFDPNQRYMDHSAHTGKYGEHAVLFWGTGIKADHSGDEETQVIFWGPSVSPNMIFPIVKEYDDWVIRNYVDRPVYQSEDINDVINWVESNWRMLQQTRQQGDPKRWV